MLFLEELGLYETALNMVATCLPLHLCEELIQQILLPRATTDHQVGPGCREGWEASSPGETPGGKLCQAPLLQFSKCNWCSEKEYLTSCKVVCSSSVDSRLKFGFPVLWTLAGMRIKFWFGFSVPVFLRKPLMIFNQSPSSRASLLLRSACLGQPCFVTWAAAS